MSFRPRLVHIEIKCGRKIDKFEGGLEDFACVKVFLSKNCINCIHNSGWLICTKSNKY